MLITQSEPRSREMHLVFVNKLFLSLITHFNVDMCNRGRLTGRPNECTHKHGYTHSDTNTHREYSWEQLQ